MNTQILFFLVATFTIGLAPNPQTKNAKFQSSARSAFYPYRKFHPSQPSGHQEGNEQGNDQPIVEQERQQMIIEDPMDISSVGTAPSASHNVQTPSGGKTLRRRKNDKQSRQGDAHEAERPSNETGDTTTPTKRKSGQESRQGDGHEAERSSNETRDTTTLTKRKSGQQSRQGDAHEAERSSEMAMSSSSKENEGEMGDQAHLLLSPTKKVRLNKKKAQSNKVGPSATTASAEPSIEKRKTAQSQASSVDRSVNSGQIKSDEQNPQPPSPTSLKITEQDEKLEKLQQQLDQLMEMYQPAQPQMVQQPQQMSLVQPPVLMQAPQVAPLATVQQQQPIQSWPNASLSAPENVATMPADQQQQNQQKLLSFKQLASMEKAKNQLLIEIYDGMNPTLKKRFLQLLSQGNAQSKSLSIFLSRPRQPKEHTQQRWLQMKQKLSQINTMLSNHAVAAQQQQQMLSPSSSRRLPTTPSFASVVLPTQLTQQMGDMVLESSQQQEQPTQLQQQQQKQQKKLRHQEQQKEIQRQKMQQLQLLKSPTVSGRRASSLQQPHNLPSNTTTTTAFGGGGIVSSGSQQQQWHNGNAIRARPISFRQPDAATQQINSDGAGPSATESNNDQQQTEQQQQRNSAEYLAERQQTNAQKEKQATASYDKQMLHIMTIEGIVYRSVIATITAISSASLSVSQSISLNCLPNVEIVGPLVNAIELIKFAPNMTAISVLNHMKNFFAPNELKIHQILLEIGTEIGEFVSYHQQNSAQTLNPEAAKKSVKEMSVLLAFCRIYRKLFKLLRTTDAKKELNERTRNFEQLYKWVEQMESELRQKLEQSEMEFGSKKDLKWCTNLFRLEDTIEAAKLAVLVAFSPKSLNEWSKKGGNWKTLNEIFTRPKLDEFLTYFKDRASIEKGTYMMLIQKYTGNKLNNVRFSKFEVQFLSKLVTKIDSSLAKEKQPYTDQTLQTNTFNLIKSLATFRRLIAAFRNAKYDVIELAHLKSEKDNAIQFLGHCVEVLDIKFDDFKKKVLDRIEELDRIRKQSMLNEQGESS